MNRPTGRAERICDYPTSRSDPETQRQQGTAGMLLLSLPTWLLQVSGNADARPRLKSRCVLRTRSGGASNTVSRLDPSQALSPDATSLWSARPRVQARSVAAPANASAAASYLVEGEPEILADAHGGRATCAEDTPARMLEGTHQIEALDAGHRVLSELGCRPVRA